MFQEIWRPDVDYSSLRIPFSWKCLLLSQSMKCYLSGNTFHGFRSFKDRICFLQQKKRIVFVHADSCTHIGHIFCSVFTPYYSETVLYSMPELLKRNEDGISILFYLQKIYPGTIQLRKYYELSE